MSVALEIIYQLGGFIAFLNALCYISFPLIERKAWKKEKKRKGAITSKKWFVFLIILLFCIPCHFIDDVFLSSVPEDYYSEKDYEDSKIEIGEKNDKLFNYTVQDRLNNFIEKPVQGISLCIVLLSTIFDIYICIEEKYRE